jgi:hypothetical protein
VLDYFHARDDRYILVDEIEVCVLSRARAGEAAAVTRGADGVTLSAGACVASGLLDSEGLRAALDCRTGTIEVTAALPERPSSVSVDGEPVEFSFTIPERVVRFEIETESFERERRAGTLWRKLERAMAGGPPGLHAEFDRGWFMPDARAPQTPSRPFPALGGPPEVLAPTPGALDRPRAGSGASGPLEAFGLAPGAFARARARFRASGPLEATISGSTDPALVFVNGELVVGLSGSAVSRRADITPLLRPDGNEIETVFHLLPRPPGFRGLHGEPPRLPEVVLTGDEGRVDPESWEVAPLLAGEEAGWTGLDVAMRRWHFIRFGPWREQGRDLVGVRGVGWYRLPFELPRSGDWSIHYRLEATLRSAGAVFVNGTRLATCSGEGSYILPLPAPPLRDGAENVVAFALYGLGPQTGLHRMELAADEEQMTRRRLLDIRF